MKGYSKQTRVKAPKDIDDYQADNFDQNSQMLLKGITKKAWKGVGLGPSFNDENFFQRYMFCQKLFERLKKYRERGLEITNAPLKALDLAEEFPSAPPGW